MSAIATPTLRFLLGHPAHFIALGFGAGLAAVAPGTVGTLLAIPLAELLRLYTGDTGYLVVVAGTIVAGAWASEVTGRDLGRADHGSIVIDEIAAFMLVLFFVGRDGVAIALAFVLFRLFDIVKPPPIRQLDRALKNGIGVMIDDLLAAGYALLTFALVMRALEWLR